MTLRTTNSESTTQDRIETHNPDTHADHNPNSQTHNLETNGHADHNWKSHNQTHADKRL